MNMKISELAKAWHLHAATILKWEHNRVIPERKNAKLADDWIAKIEAEYGTLKLPDRGGQDIARLQIKNKLTKGYIANHLGVDKSTLRSLQRKKVFDLKPGVFEMVKKIKELESQDGMPNRFTEMEMKEFLSLIIKKSGRIRSLTRTGPFNYWTVLRWRDGSNWPTKHSSVKKLRKWILKLKAMEQSAGS